VTKYVPSVTVITRADTDAIAAAARGRTPDTKDYYPRSFEHWPCDPAVFAPPIAIDCDELDRRQRDA
jgi:hypothetical protein